jgi:hypothetical protein
MIKTGGWVLLLIVVAIGWTFALPREATGSINLYDAGSCETKVDINPQSFSAYFKTFACVETSDTKDCYYLEYQNGVCTMSYHYHETK